jgi:hypothetical protein
MHLFNLIAVSLHVLLGSDYKILKACSSHTSAVYSVRRCNHKDAYNKGFSEFSFLGNSSLKLKKE